MKMSEFSSKTLLLYCLLSQFSISFGYVIQDKVDAYNYLARFGYIEPNTVNDMNTVEARPYLMEFQKMFGITQTGQLDSKTMQMMNMPRCGNKDMNTPMNSEQGYIRVQRYAVSRGWRTRALTYRITRHSSSQELNRESVEADIDKAFRMWESVTNLNFTKASQNQRIDIDIQFTAKNHSDDAPFDGPGMTLAHAYLPRTRYAGYVHFDDSEPWLTRSPRVERASRRRVDVLFVAIHEIGHSLGLLHSNVRGAIMEPMYPGYIQDLQLHNDDIAGIRSLYGARELPVSTARTTETSISRNQTNTNQSPEVSLCDDPKIDAAFTTKRKINVLKGSYMYTIDSSARRGVVKGPKRIEKVLKNFEPPMDACFTQRTTANTYCFKQNMYWRISGTKMSQVSPQNMTLSFPGIPRDVDAAFEWPRNGRFYFFKGDQYWVFDPTARSNFVRSDYPQPISKLGLNVNSIDAAFVHPRSNRVYVFKNESYWQFRNNLPMVLQMQPTPSRLLWPNCT